MTDELHSCGFHCQRPACVDARAREWEEQRRRIAELEDQLRLANIDAANAVSECNELAHQVDTMRSVMSEVGVNMPQLNKHRAIDAHIDAEASTIEQARREERERCARVAYAELWDASYELRKNVVKAIRARGEEK